MKLKLTLIALIGISIFGNLTSVRAENLGTELRKSGWEGIIGTWVDPETKGAKHRVTYRWQYKDKVIEITNRDTQKETTALMGRNPKSGKIFHVAADNEGGSSIGKWTFENNEFVLGLLFVAGTGEEGILQIRHKLINHDTLVVTVVLPEPITLKLERLKE